MTPFICHILNSVLCAYIPPFIDPATPTTMKSTLLHILIFGASMAQAVQHVVTLGLGGNLTFNPDEITANIGDTIEFQFAKGVCFTMTRPDLY